MSNNSEESIHGANTNETSNSLKGDSEESINGANGEENRDIKIAHCIHDVLIDIDDISIQDEGLDESRSTLLMKGSSMRA